MVERRARLREREGAPEGMCAAASAPLLRVSLRLCLHRLHRLPLRLHLSRLKLHRHLRIQLAARRVKLKVATGRKAHVEAHVARPTALLLR